VTAADTPVLGKQEVLLGVIVLEGQMMMQLVAEIGVCVKRTISELVSVPESYIILSIIGEHTPGGKNTLYGPGLTITFRYILLPLKSRADEASRMFLEASAQPSPPFLAKLAVHMRQNKDLEWMAAASDEWRIEIRQPIKSTMDVEYPADYELTQTPSLQKATSSTGSTTPRPASSEQCRQALHPCTCAALSRCAWVSDANGISSCVAGSSTSITGVSCSACAAQERCPAAACARIRDPCYCSVSDASCRWNEAFRTCEKNNGAGTSCIACAAQSHCTPPRIVSFHPPSGSKLSAQTGSRIRVAFDRSLWFMSSPGAVELRCYGEALAVGIPYGQMKLEANVLIVDVSSVTGSYNGDAVRRCSLVVGERIVAGQDGVPFLGMQDGEYAILFGDNVAPQVLDFNPRNGQVDVAPSTVVTLTFSEPIVLGPGVKSAQLSRLEAGETVSSVEDLKLSPPRVAVDSTRLKVDLTGMAEAGIHYSLSLPTGAVADLSQNEFGGLPTRAYAFRTAPAVLRTGHTGERTNLNPATLKIIAASGGAVLLALCAVVVWRICRLRQLQKSYLQKAASRPVGSRLNTVRPSQEEQTDRPSMLRHASSASLGVPQMPETQAPLDAFEDTLRSDNSELFRKSDSFRKTDSWPSGQFGSPQFGRHNSRSSRTSERSVHSASDAARKQWAQQVQATRKWHQAFAKAAAARKGSEAFKSAQATSGEPQRGSRHTTRSSSPSQKERPPGPYTRRQTWSPGQSPKQSPKSSTTASSPEGDAERKSPSGATGGTAGRGSTRRSSSPGPAGAAHGSRSQSNHSAHGGSQSDFDGRRSSKNSTASRISLDDATGFSPEDAEPLKQQKREVLKRMRSLMDSPIAERKKVLRELMLEYHPDKNSDQYAKEIFQFINANKGWFLSET